jgi:undecaprenyl-diphosphatase
MELSLLQQIILGIIQGITEWLPISSSAFISLAASNWFNLTSVDALIKTALFFHLGTFFAALIYFWSEVKNLFKTLVHYKSSTAESKKIFNFIFLSTLISGLVGIIILQILTLFSNSMELTGKTITFAIAILLLITGIIQLKPKKKGLRKEKNLNYKDSILLGFAQGFATLPGLSRSGITISSLLLRKFDDTSSLRLSFIMSLPIIILGNILLNVTETTFTLTSLIGLLAAFVFGYLTIHALMKLSKKINFGWFVIVFAILMGISLLF